MTIIARKLSSPTEHRDCHCHRPGRRHFLRAGLIVGTGLVLPFHGVNANSVQQLSGSVFVNRRYASTGTAVNPGDMVTVAHGSSAAFTLGDDAYILRGGTTMQIESGDRTMVSVLRLITGAILAVFGRGEKTIVTRNATIGVRGTGLYLDTAPEQTYFCTCYGETELNVHGLKSEIIKAEHHNAVMINTPYAGKNEIHSMAGFEYHTDDELRAAEAMQGRMVPFDQN
jgi:hypothetical protein